MYHNSLYSIRTGWDNEFSVRVFLNMTNGFSKAPRQSKVWASVDGRSMQQYILDGSLFPPY